MKFILGEKLEMSQRFKENGTVIPVTLVAAGPCKITQIKTKEKDGYNAVQIGFGLKRKVNKPLAGHLKELGNFRYLREIRMEELGEYKKGQEIGVNIFSPGDKVKIIGTSKGKGFAGVVKRHGFHGHPPSHGHKDAERMPGSIGSGGIQRVFKGLKMAGRMGGERVTVKNLEVIEVDAGKNILALKGAVPGAKGALVLIVQ